MAGSGHEWIKCELTMKISQGLADAATRDDNSHSAREFALLPTSKCGSTSLKYRSSKVAGKKVTRQPDAQFLSDLRHLPQLDHRSSMDADYEEFVRAGMRLHLG